jgi:hypothetical protein
MAAHIVKSEQRAGKSAEVAARIAWATVTKQAHVGTKRPAS